MRGRGRGVLGDQMSVGGSERAAVQPDAEFTILLRMVGWGEENRGSPQV